jgi:hypothetical protein
MIAGGASRSRHRRSFRISTAFMGSRHKAGNDEEMLKLQ